MQNISQQINQRILSISTTASGFFQSIVQYITLNPVLTTVIALGALAIITFTALFIQIRSKLKKISNDYNTLSKQQESEANKEKGLHSHHTQKIADIEALQATSSSRLSEIEGTQETVGQINKSLKQLWHDTAGIKNQLEAAEYLNIQPYLADQALSDSSNPYKYRSICVSLGITEILPESSNLDASVFEALTVKSIYNNLSLALAVTYIDLLSDQKGMEVSGSSSRAAEYEDRFKTISQLDFDDVFLVVPNPSLDEHLQPLYKWSGEQTEQPHLLSVSGFYEVVCALKPLIDEISWNKIDPQMLTTTDPEVQTKTTILDSEEFHERSKICILSDKHYEIEDPNSIFQSEGIKLSHTIQTQLKYSPIATPIVKPGSDDKIKEIIALAYRVSNADPSMNADDLTTVQKLNAYNRIYQLLEETFLEMEKGKHINKYVRKCQKELYPSTYYGTRKHMLLELLDTKMQKLVREIQSKNTSVFNPGVSPVQGATLAGSETTRRNST
jgi:hypothetical protein